MPVNPHLVLLLLVQLVALAARTKANDPTFKLRVSHDSVVKGLTENVTVHCGMQGPTPGKEIYQIVIYQQRRGRLVTPIAALEGMPKQYDSTKVTSKSNLIPNETYLEVTWPLADNDTAGTFWCDGNIVPEGEGFFNSMSEKVEIKEAEVSREMLMEGLKRLDGNGEKFMNLLLAIKNRVDDNGAEFNVKMPQLFGKMDVILATCQNASAELVDINQDTDRMRNDTHSTLQGVQKLIKLYSN